MKTKKELSEMTREELGQELMKMPLETMEQADEEIRQFHERIKQMDKIDEDNPLPDELIHKNMHDINTFQCTTDNELYLRGTDEYGKDFKFALMPLNF
jgi:hypothetical protein